MSKRTLAEVYEVILQRQQSGGEKSYVSSLMKKGTDAILKKIGEEATEVVIAAKNDDVQDRVHEITDLWFHSLVLMAHTGITVDDIEVEFGRRFGTSGLEEKANRPVK